MFENYIKSEKARVIELFNKRAHFINLKDILDNKGIDLQYKAYLTAEANWWIYEEQMLRKTNMNFNMSEANIQNLHSELDNLLFVNARFDMPGLKTIIDSAVKTRLNMAIRPRTTLKWFVFRGEPTKTVNEITLRLDYFSDNRYVIDEFLKRLEEGAMVRSDNDIFSVIEFEKMIENVDNDQIYELSPEGFVELTQPIFEFFENIVDFPVKGSVPTESIIIFLDDKQLSPLSKALEERFYAHDLKFINRKQLLDFLYEIINLSDTTSYNQSLEERVENIAEKDEDETMTGTTEDLSVEPVDDQPKESLNINFDLKIPDDFLKAKDEVFGTMPAIEDESQYLTEREAEIDLITMTTSPSVTQPETPRKTISELITDTGNEELFITNLFHTDEEAYYGFINLLEETASFDDALIFINKVYDEYGVPAGSEVSVEFLKTIRNAYK